MTVGSPYLCYRSSVKFLYKVRSVIVRVQDVHGAVSSHLKLNKGYLLSITCCQRQKLLLLNH